MKLMKKLTFATLAAMAATLLFQTPITLADDRASQGDHEQRIKDRFVILLAGIYQRVPLGHGPNGNLGLTTVDLSDGSYTKVKFIR
jgi:hypothetical protein